MSSADRQITVDANQMDDITPPAPEQALPKPNDLRRIAFPVLGGPNAVRVYASPQRDHLMGVWPRLMDGVRTGKSLRSQLAEHKIPVETFYALLGDSAAHSDQYTHAREARADHWEDRLETVTEQAIDGQLDPNIARVAGQNIQWLAAIQNKGKYNLSNKIDVTVTHRPAPELDTQQLMAIAASGRIVDVESRAVEGPEAARLAHETSDTATPTTTSDGMPKPPDGTQAGTKPQATE